MRKSGLLLIVALLGTAGVVRAVDYTKSDAATADWNAAAWSPVPGTWTSGDKAFITGGAVNLTPTSNPGNDLAAIEVKASVAGTTLNISQYIRTANNFVMNYNNAGTATVNHSAGEFRSNGNAIIGWKGAGNTAVYNLTDTGLLKGSTSVYIGRESTGTMNIDGGTVDVWGSGDKVYVGSGTGSSGAVNLSAGTLKKTAGRIEVGAAGTGVIDQTGGTLWLAGGADMFLGAGSAGSATYTISGGSITNESGWFSVNNDATFTVDGSGATFIELNDLNIENSGTFAINLDAGGSTLVKGSAGVDFFAGESTVLELDTISGFNGVNDDVYDLFWAPTGMILTNDMTFANLSGSTDFDLSIVSGVNGGDVLRATVIPEPATLGLVAAFGGVALWVRRTFMI